MTSPSDRDPDLRDVRAELREAYERGRRDAARARRRRPLTASLAVIAAAVGVVVLALAALNGSFSQAGAVVDRTLAAAASAAKPAARNAADQAGQAVRRAAEGTEKTDRPS